MGAIWFGRNEFVGWLSELVGVKLGLAVTEFDLERAITEKGFSASLPDGPDALYRLRAEDAEETAQAVLAAFGDPDADRIRNSPPTSLTLIREFAGFPDTLEVMTFVLQKIEAAISSNAKVDSAPILEEVRSRWGVIGSRVAIRLMEELNARNFTSPWTRLSRRKYNDRAELRALFESELLPTELNVFFDQRFIDYLHANAERVGSIHWRQFEGMVAEWFRRAGLRVELGPGRNDDGVDVRVWNPAGSAEAPALLLVQCKREGTKTTKVVVKAMASDVLFEGATQGMVATTSFWSPGARETVRSRKYPVEEANKTHIADWIQKMHTPGAGAWLTE